MKSWQEDHLNSLLTIESEQELFDEIAMLAKDMGFDYCAYGIQMSVPISRPFVASFNSGFARKSVAATWKPNLSFDLTSRRAMNCWFRRTTYSSTHRKCGMRRASWVCTMDGPNFHAMPAVPSAC